MSSAVPMCRSYGATACSHISPVREMTFNYYITLIKDVYLRFVPLWYFLFGVPCLAMLVVPYKNMSTVVLPVCSSSHME